MKPVQFPRFNALGVQQALHRLANAVTEAMTAQQAFGELYLAVNPAAAGAFPQLPAWGLLDTFDSQGVSQWTTPVVGTSSITVATAGIWRVDFKINYDMSFADILHFQIARNGSALGANLYDFMTSISGQWIELGIHGLAQLDADDVVTVQVASQNGAVTTCRVRECNLLVTKVG